MNGVGPLLPHSYTFGSDPIPKTRLISHVSNATAAVVTTTEDHGYLTGYIVTVTVPPEYGMSIPGLDTEILVTSDDTFIANDIDTLHALTYSAPTSSPPFTQAQVTPMSGLTRNAERSDGTF